MKNATSSEKRVARPSETIFNGPNTIIAFPDVCFIQKVGDGLMVILKNTYWSNEAGAWANASYLSAAEASLFMVSYCTYRYEIDQPLDIMAEVTA